MQPNQQTTQLLHKKLPIDQDEKVIAVYRHHWFAYMYSWFITIFVIVVIFALAALLTTGDSPLSQYQSMVLSGAAFLGLMILIGGLIPAYLRSQEQLVLTDESLLKLLKPTLLSHKVDQLGLQHVADVSVIQGAVGTMFGFGTLTIETAGEQRTSYDFSVVADPTKVAQQISEMKENFDAALQGGRIESNLPNQLPKAPQIDPQQYAEFLKYQEMVRMQGAGPQNSSAPPAASSQPQADSDQPGQQ